EELVEDAVLLAAPARAADGIARHSAELLEAEAVPGGADDAEALGHQPDLSQVEHPRQQLALGEVPRRTKENDHLVRGAFRRRLPNARARRGNANAHSSRLT